jgi:hypothetical protein
MERRLGSWSTAGNVTMPHLMALADDQQLRAGRRHMKGD